MRTGQRVVLITRGSTYKVKRLVNRTTPRIESILKESEVKAIIKEDKPGIQRVTVEILEDK